MASDPGAPAAPDMGQAPAWQQALTGGQQSTGAGDFGRGARLPAGYGQGQNPNPAMNQQADPWAQQAQSQAGAQFQPQPQPQAAGDPRAQYARDAAANNYKDIQGAGSLATGNFMGNLEGFNTGAWGTEERGSNTHKNTFGKIASRYDPRQPGATKSLMADPDFQAYFPDARIVEHPNGDLIDFGDGNPVDVLRGAQAGGAGEGWQWGVDAGGPPQGAPGMQGAPQGGDQQLNSMLTALQGGGGGFDQGISIEQIMAALGMQGQAQSFMQPQQPQR